MPDENGASEQRTRESRLLDRFPGLRESVASLPDFIAWNDGFPLIDVDDESFRVARGDQLMDRDQMMVEWIRLFRPQLLEGGTQNDG
ncbi:hypothetical protein KMT30_18480 [Streptomyces sp. IBSBF 2953]|uniref:hypothetical protein n=1 Tax=Streptomyces TaxID=1883 RepID=UPI00211A46C4|nr:hypothetical protein [Streptomyces scabiei]MCQ9180990.1 hypothetical protein [Streptomyces hayashii]MDX3113256.1 hypothetical protein [Streptomyces scabiei]